MGDLPKLKLPENDHNLIAAVHFYDPYFFTHQGAAWLGDLVATTGIVFPGPPAEPLDKEADGWLQQFLANYNGKPVEANPCGGNAIANRLRLVGQWAEFYGRPVHVGEFGCYERADAASRVAYCGQVRRELAKLGLGWAMWDWKSGFHYSRDGKPDPAGMRDALFGKD